MSAELDEIKAEIAELGAFIRRERRLRRKDKRPSINFKLNEDEAAILNAACTEKGMSRSDIIRAGLNAVLGTTFPLNRETPPALRSAINRKLQSRSVLAPDAAISKAKTPEHTRGMLSEPAQPFAKTVAQQFRKNATFVERPGKAA